MKNRLIGKSLTVFHHQGCSGFFHKLREFFVRETTPFMRQNEHFFYWYAQRKISLETAKKHTAESAASFLFDTFGHFITPKQVRWEIIELGKIIQDLKPQTIVEIGTARGGTLFLFSRLAPANAQIVSIDFPWEMGGGYPPNRTPLYEKFASPTQKISFLRADSHQLETKTKLTDILEGRKIDFLFIDGDHTYDGVKKDYEQYSPLVRPGGVIAFHDVTLHPAGYDCEVSRFWNEIRTEKNCREFIENPDQGWGGIGVILT